MGLHESSDRAMSSTMTYARLEDLLIVVSRPGDTVPEAFSALVAALRDDAVKRVIGFSFGDATTTSDQRKALSEALVGKRAVALTDNVMVRGLLVALRWLGSTISSFPHHELDKALAALHCEIPSARVRQTARELALAAGWMEIARQLRE
jgi:hypothetical protein